LKIENRNGEFPGMLPTRTFKVVLLGSNLKEKEIKQPVEKIINYLGKEISLSF